jgi:uncharacterized protein HemX
MGINRLEITITLNKRREEMKKKGFGKTVVCWMLILAFGIALTGCGASMTEIKRVEAMAQQALENSEAAKAACADDAQRAQNAAARAENAAARAESAAGQAEQSAAKAEAIFMKKMHK